MGFGVCGAWSTLLHLTAQDISSWPPGAPGLWEPGLCKPLSSFGLQYGHSMGTGLAPAPGAKLSFSAAFAAAFPTATDVSGRRLEAHSSFSLGTSSKISAPRILPVPWPVVCHRAHSVQFTALFVVTEPSLIMLPQSLGRQMVKSKSQSPMEPVSVFQFCGSV